MDSSIQALEGILEFLKSREIGRLTPPKPEAAPEMLEAEGQIPGEVSDQVEGKEVQAEGSADAQDGDDEKQALMELYSKLG